LLDDALRRFLNEPIAVLLGTRDAARAPAVVRGYGVRAVGASTVRVPIIRSQCAEILRDLEDNGAIAVSISHVVKYEAYQLKGRGGLGSPVDDVDRQTAADCLERYIAELTPTGFDERMLRNANWVPDATIEVSVEEVFVQTPGPGAGRKRESSA
jgi:hypothetical protein